MVVAYYTIWNKVSLDLMLLQPLQFQFQTNICFKIFNLMQSISFIQGLSYPLKVEHPV